MRLLLVEDNEILVDGLTIALEDEGHQVFVSTHARPAIGMINRVRPDAVILDISLPDMDGLQLAQFIRMDHPTLPIVFASGHDHDQPRLAEAAKDPKTALLRKPYEVAALLETLHRLKS